MLPGFLLGLQCLLQGNDMLFCLMKLVVDVQLCFKGLLLEQSLLSQPRILLRLLFTPLTAELVLLSVEQFDGDQEVGSIFR